MSNVITSPGIQFNEIDFTATVRTSNANTVYMVGYSKQGPVYEPTYISTLTEFEDIFGAPVNPAERYLYHSAKQIVQRTNSQLLVTRLPYEIDQTVVEEGTTAKQLTHNMLVYPLSTDRVSNDTFSITGASNYSVLPPLSIVVDQGTYDLFVQNGFNWLQTVNLSAAGLGNTPALSATPIGFIISNDAGTSVNNIFEGYYIGLADNTNVDPSSGFNCITGINVMNESIVPYTFTTSPTITAKYAGYSGWTKVDPQRLAFSIYQDSITGGTKNTISDIVLKYPIGYTFNGAEYDDSLIITIFSLRKSIYETTNVQLADVLLGGYVGSLNFSKTRVGIEGGAAKSVFIENEINTVSPYISMFVNPTLSHQNFEDTTSAVVTSKKKVRIHPKTKNLYALGVYGTINTTDKKNLGDLPAKLSVALEVASNPDTYSIDVTCDAGLSTIWTAVQARVYKYSATPGATTWTAASGQKVFNDEELLGGIVDERDPATEILRISDIHGKDGSSGKGSQIISWHNEIASKFVSFAGEVRRDHIHVSDPLRYIFVEGQSFKKIDRKSTSTGTAFDFTKEIYWPLANLYSKVTSSYVSTYPIWFKTSDPNLKRDIWIPPSGVIAANIINTSPFEAPAGFTRGVVTGVSDTGLSPNQKQRDLLYKLSQNSVTSFPGEGVVIFGQKTMLNRPSAFDRLNVRRTFIHLEKATNSAIKYFVFEPNTFLTRGRVINTLTPIYENAKNSSGIYDYQIVCDERNNPPAAVDQNELHVDVYIKPVRTAEFVLVNFYATRTDQNFSELIG